MSKRKSSRKPFHQAMSNLIKTVKVEAPTLWLGKRPAAAEAKTEVAVAPSKPAASPRFSPFKAQAKGPGLVRSPRRTPPSPRSPLSKGTPAMKSAKARAAAARRPMIAALMALILACGGYYLYRHLSMPKVQVKHVATQWLDRSAGKRTAHVIHHPAVTRHLIGCHAPQHTVAAGHSTSRHSQAVAKHKARSHQKTAAKGKLSKHKRANVASSKPQHNVQQASYYPTN